ncbi:glucoamylase family protein [Labedella endophytica]|uniref:DUF3131 domain-containing protein n=1 Tax=Labedella endophytica TaxID=1523160 RepID=A0A3S0WYY3_9MICO|nr:glucoamylase family protein [Labedella endophytica]RUR01502.1 DUF3131 domain-containing protein [Labedella endophytica]
MGRRVAARGNGRNSGARGWGRRRTAAATALGGVVLVLLVSACAALAPQRGLAGRFGDEAVVERTPSLSTPADPGSTAPTTSPGPTRIDEDLLPAAPGVSAPPVPDDAADGDGSDSAETGGDGWGGDRAEDDRIADEGGDPALTAEDEATLRLYAVDTWASMDAMLVPETGLVADHVDSSLREPAPYTSPTDIGGYLWSAVVARDLGIITADDAASRMRSTVSTLASMERHTPSGMFYNWYSPQTAEKLTVWPGDDETISSFLSTVDNGWLAAALRIAAAAEPTVAEQATALSMSMDFSSFLDEEAADGAGLMRVGFWPERPLGQCAEKDGDVFSTCASYDTIASEARIASYVGIANGQLPESSYAAPSRTGPVSASGSGWMKPRVAQTRSYDGFEVLESTYSYDGMDIVPSWDGSMFEALMPDLLVPEADWGPRSWALNHAATVAAQSSHTVGPAGASVWGVSPAADPAGGYGVYGIDGLSIRATLAASGVTASPGGSSDPRRPGTPERGRTVSGDVVTPYASFLALPYDPRGAMENLERLRVDYGLYGPGGFADAVDARSGLIADTHLSLDQSMILASVGNALGDGLLQRYFVSGCLEERLRPLVEQQVFGTTLE